jgi:glucose-1-phosphatase
MSSNKYDVIFCDLGNVLINFDHKIAVRKILYGTLKNEQEIHQLFFDSNLTKDYEEGKISSLDFFKKVKDSLGLDADYNKSMSIWYTNFLPIWNNIFFEVTLNKNMQNLIREAKGQYKLVMISNINETHFEYLKNVMPIFKEFDKFILSYQIGFRKPAKEIYDAALKSVNAEPSKVFYVDDRADLVKAALSFGINGIVLNGEEAFKKIEKELFPDKKKI